MSSPLPDKKKRTFGDYRQWEQNLLCEIIEGEIYDMSPAPSRRHQKISMELSRQIANFLLESPCEVYHAPFDVRLPKGKEADNDIDTVVQPDVLVVCDRAKLDEMGCRGTPDLIIEITSPTTASKDHIQKLALYEKHGVGEYWLIHPVDCIVTIRILQENGRYGIPKIIEGKGPVAVTTLPGLSIDMDSLFREAP